MSRTTVRRWRKKLKCSLPLRWTQRCVDKYLNGSIFLRIILLFYSRWCVYIVSVYRLYYTFHFRHLALGALLLHSCSLSNVFLLPFILSFTRSSRNQTEYLSGYSGQVFKCDWWTVRIQVLPWIVSFNIVLGESIKTQHKINKLFSFFIIWSFHLFTLMSMYLCILKNIYNVNH